MTTTQCMFLLLAVLSAAVLVQVGSDVIRDVRAVCARAERWPS